MKATHKMEKVLIARTDKIGDVVLTLPLAGIIKTYFPHRHVAFLGSSYTEAVVKKSAYIDDFYNWDSVKDLSVCEADVAILVSPRLDLAQAMGRAGIPTRIGTSRRWFHWLHANRRVSLKRRGSNLHEAQLNVRLLSALGINKTFTISELHHYYGWQKERSRSFSDILSTSQYNVVLHPKSGGNGCEWPTEYYAQLARSLNPAKFNILLSGSSEEGATLRKEHPCLLRFPHVVDITGRYDLASFIALIEQVDCLVASGTGPVHIAAAAGTSTIGLYPPVKPIHPGRWQPIGKNVRVLCQGELSNNKNDLDKIRLITPEAVKNTIYQSLEVDV